MISRFTICHSKQDGLILVYRYSLDWWNKIESKNRSILDGKLIVDKGINAIEWGENVFSTCGAEKDV